MFDIHCIKIISFAARAKDALSLVYYVEMKVRHD
jgi:hypothetical protein